MKLKGKAFVVKDEWGQGVYIMHNTGSNEIPFQLRYFEKIHNSYNHDSAENLCLSLNNWRESFADVIAMKRFNPENQKWEYIYD